MNPEGSARRDSVRPQGSLYQFREPGTRIGHGTGVDHPGLRGARWPRKGQAQLNLRQSAKRIPDKPARQPGRVHHVRHSGQPPGKLHSPAIGGGWTLGGIGRGSCQRHQEEGQRLHLVSRFSQEMLASDTGV